MGRGSFPIGSVAGIRIALHPTWLIIALLVTLSFAFGELPFLFPTLPTVLHLAIGMAVTLLFFASVLAHELCHALVARRLGIGVKDITLFIFGGAATLERDAKSPREEALVAIAGPLCSLVIGAVLVAVAVLVDQRQLSVLSGWLGVTNLLLGAFNIIPAFPMDGGRILRALLWRVRGDQYKATRSAAWVGRIFGYALIVLGVWWTLLDEDWGRLWLALIGWFIANAAGATVTQMGVQRSLAGVLVRQVMDPAPASVSPNESVAELVNERLVQGGARSFLVQHDDGGLAGIVTLSDVRRVAREDWPAARVTDIMTRYDSLARVGPDDGVEAALQILQDREVNQLPVVEEDGRTVVGLLTRAGILRLVDTRLKLGV
ncbi:MAG TPA: site-2 protease family protein [Candidatus Limnocylindria bacterium]|nr:site-2 protease family protein [Candidatus Limnocylindria bacterium]